MNAEITTREFMELVTESCKYRAIKEYVEGCKSYVDDGIIRALVGVKRKEDNDV